MAKAQGLVCVVTGGVGCLGSHLVELLASNESYAEIRVIDLQPFITEDYAITVDGAKKIRIMQGSITDKDLVSKACDGADVVFHVAALVDWGRYPREALFDVNVTGTEVVIDACKSKKVPALVYTSTMDVCCWRGQHHINVGDDEAKVPEDPKDFLYRGAYAETKAIAERMSLKVNGYADHLRTVSLRVTSLYGERDMHSIPSFVQAAEAGSLTIRLGSPDIVMTHVYAKNAAHAHIMAAKELLKGEKARCQGRSYFLSEDYPPTNFWDFFAPFVVQAGHSMPAPYPYIPAWLTMLIAYINVFVAWLLSPFIKYELSITPGAVVGILHSHGFIGTRAERDFGYKPIFSCEEGMERTLAYFAKKREGGQKEKDPNTKRK